MRHDAEWRLEAAMLPKAALQPRRALPTPSPIHGCQKGATPAAARFPACLSGPP